jgi:hypothetical protein
MICDAASDIYTIDESLVTTLRTYLQTLFGVASTVVVISCVTPVFMFCLIPMILFYANEQKFFMVRLHAHHPKATTSAITYR